MLFFTRKGDALNQLKLRNGDLAKGKPITAAQFKLAFDDAVQAVLNDYTTNGRRSLSVVQCRIDKHPKPYFGGRRLADIGADQVLAYVAHRQQQGIVNKKGERIGNVSNAQINRELEVLKRCFSLALQHGKIFTKPHIEMLKEAAPRAGFLGRDQVDAICAHLSTELAAVIRFAFITGWRIPSEVLTLEWRQVDSRPAVFDSSPACRRMAKAGSSSSPANCGRSSTRDGRNTNG